MDLFRTDDCKLLTGDCGGRDAAPPAVTMWAGMKANIVFQKNLDHYNMKKPGNFSVNVSPMGDTMKWTPLNMVKDSNTTSLYLYEVMVDVPKTEMDHAVLQVVYYTSNSEAPPYFYQCADIAVKKPPQ